MALFYTAMVFRETGCDECAHFYRMSDVYELDELECKDGDFGQEYPCQNILDAVAQLIESDRLDSRDGFITTAEATQEYTEERSFNWADFPYWFVGANGKRIGFKDIADVWRGAFLDY